MEMLYDKKFNVAGGHHSTALYPCDYLVIINLVFYLTTDEELSAQELLGAHESLDTERITRADGQKGGGGRQGVGGGEMGNTQKGVQTNIGPDSEAVNHTPDQISISSDVDKRGKVNTNVGGS